uniref:Uncharacterized protein n=1 Tax=Melopsittacus undulatus TaxID=13146 RepID=A0A8V5GKQ2_MELUD
MLIPRNAWEVLHCNCTNQVLQNGERLKFMRHFILSFFLPFAQAIGMDLKSIFLSFYSKLIFPKSRVIPMKEVQDFTHSFKKILHV